MKKSFILIALFCALCLFFYSSSDAFARAGGGGRSGGSIGGGFRGSSGSYGSRGSRTYSAPARPSSPSNAYSASPSRTPISQPYQTPYQTPYGGGFMRSLVGGLIGGVIGSFLFSRLGYAGFGTTGGLFGGIGVIEIIIGALLIYFIVKLLKGRREQEAPSSWPNKAYAEPEPRYGASAPEPQQDAFSQGIREIKQFDQNFRENDFKEEASDIFFKVQAAWMNRDIAPISNILASDIASLLSEDLARLRREGRINRLENIAVREIDITEAWREQGIDYVTVRITASVLDYTTDEAGAIVEGSKTSPVRFVEYWTFSREVGKTRWQLGAIQQEG